MSIVLGGRDFAGPYPIDQWIASHESGIYVVLRCRYAPDGTPDYAPLYFGRTPDLAADDLPTGHPRFARWVNDAGGREHLYVGVLYLPGATTMNRELVKEALLSQYQPADNYS